MTMFAFQRPRRTRSPSLTPMIDVVFLLLVFFILAARFGNDRALQVTAAGAGGVDWRGPPRLVEIAPDALTLNGVPVTEAALARALGPLMTVPSDAVVLRAVDGADLQRLVTVVDGLRAGGLTTLMIAE
jgi:biopolymer transport protein ExbD